ncbi:MAG: ABC transporter permease [Actinobacteria bacterium]|nr:ABC transporter permease [Actinomycetota bacterium]
MRLSRVDRVVLAGVTLGLFSISIPAFVTYRPNRLAAGESLNLWSAIGAWAILFYLLWLSLVIVVPLVKNDTARNAATGVLANALFVLGFLFAGIAATDLASSENPFARTSLAAGFWLNTLAAYIVLVFARQNLGQDRVLGTITTYAGFGGAALLAAGGFVNELSIMQELVNNEERFIAEALRHLTLSGIAVTIGSVIGVTLGIIAFKNRASERPAFLFVNFVQTIPSLALFGLMIAPLAYFSDTVPFLRQLGVEGIGTAPALIALTLYSLLPITRNTFTSLSIIPSGVIDAGFGMGMSRRQLLIKVQIPLALPVVLTGVRTSAVQAIGNTTVAALIGAGGLGTFVLQGLGQAAPDLILLGAISIIFIALAADTALQALITALTPKGVSGAAQ